MRGTTAPESKHTGQSPIEKIARSSLRVNPELESAVTELRLATTAVRPQDQ